MGRRNSRAHGRVVASGEIVIDIRALTTPAEMHQAVALQKVIWGFEDVELLPVRLFTVATKIGGQAFGAFDNERMVGFCLAIPGVKPGASAYLHSHMLGVTASHRDYGIGRMLKLRQREDAIARGIELMEWTFDPLEIKNAYFNIERLGAVVRRFVRNQYGTTTSHLHRGMPTDRCTAEWWIQSPRVIGALSGASEDLNPVEARIAVPADPDLARAQQERVSGEFSEYFERGLAVTGFERSDSEGIYLLTKWQ